MTTAPQDTRPRTPRLVRGLRLAGASALALALVGGGAATAGADPVAADPERRALSGAAQEDAAAYWTEERMENATPAEELVDDDALAAEESAPADGAPTPQPTASPSPTSVPSAGSLAGTDHIGKVFFTLGGEDYVCSGNSVASTNGSTVSTAGHCVNEGGGAWVTNWVFAPGYDNGETPYGLWAATDIVSTEQWVSSGDISYDVAFAVVAPETGSATLTDAVGGSGITFDAARGEQYTAWGYPAEAPFTGETLEDCAGTASDDDLGGTLSQGIDCDMTGGSSGGPWFLGGHDGYQNSVNSFGYDQQPGVMYGPTFGADAEQAYEEAAAL